MANIIALIIFGGSFIGIFALVAKKFSVLTNLPEQQTDLIVKNPIKQNILQKTDLIKQAVLHNDKMQMMMAKTTGKFKTIFTNRIVAIEDLKKVERIQQEGDYWQKVETHKFPKKKLRKNLKKEITKAKVTKKIENIENLEASLQTKKPRTRKKKAE